MHSLAFFGLMAVASAAPAAPIFKRLPNTRTLTFPEPYFNVTNSSAPGGPLFKRLPATKNSSVPETHISAAQSSYWYANVDHSTSSAPFSQDPSSFAVYKTVSSGDDLQDAINSQSGGDRPSMWAASDPRVVYVPPGTYALSSTLNFKTDTVLLGDANSPPTISAADGFNGDALINGQDPGVCDDSGCRGELSFSCQIKNVIIDTTAVDASSDFTALLWSVAQNCALSNVRIVMPKSSNGSGHKGIKLARGSTIALADTRIENGLYGVYHNGHQQALYKGLYFYQNTVGFYLDGGNSVSILGATFDTVGTSVQQAGSSAWIAMVDCVSKNSGTFLSSDQYSNFMIENLDHDNSNDIAVVRGETVVKSASHVNTYVYGNTAGADPVYQTGGPETYNPRPSALVDGSGKYPIPAAPSYANVSVDQFVNVKDSNQNGGKTVHGDGKTDDAAALNAILSDAASQNKIVYFPFGVYIVESTLVIPPGSQIVGEGWSTISGRGDAFSDSGKPTAVVQVGAQGSTGKAQIQDLRFTVAEPLAGAKIVEVNMAGGAPGDVAIWNSPITIGGFPDADFGGCGDASNECQAAFVGLHLTSDSSAYIENVWVWTADHAADDSTGGGNIATGRGVLVESTKATWLVGLGSEHHWLYNLNYHNAQNVFMGFLQSETNYDQGSNTQQQMPAPWTPDVDTYGDPDYSWCDGDDAGAPCNMALAQYVNGGSQIFSYAAGSWSFFSGPGYQECGDSCQGYMNMVDNKPDNLQLFGLGTKSAQYVLRAQDGTRYAQDPDFKGSWTGLMANYPVDATHS